MISNIAMETFILKPQVWHCGPHRDAWLASYDILATEPHKSNSFQCFLFNSRICNLLQIYPENLSVWAEEEIYAVCKVSFLSTLI